MRLVVEALRWSTTVVYLGAAIAALRIARRSRDAAARWLAGAFGSLGVILIAGVFFPDPPHTGAFLLAAKALVVILLCFPYFLLRFADSLGVTGERTVKAALAGVVLLSMWTAALPRFVAQGDPIPAWYQPYLFSFMGLWFATSMAVTRRLWAAGRGTAPIIRKRLRTMAVGAALVALIMIGSVATGGNSRPADATLLINRVLGSLSGLMFFVAFAAPRWLRVIWRRGQEHTMYEAASTCIRAASVADLVSALLPRVTSTLGGTGAALTSPSGIVLGACGLSGEEAAALAAEAGDRPGVLTADFERGRLIVALNPRSTFIGDDERNLLRSFGGFADLALERFSLLDRNERMRAEFVAMLSHDMRAPLAAARGMIETLATEWNHLDDGLRDDLLERASKNGIKLGGLIEQLLEHSQLEAGRVEPFTESVNVARVVADVTGNLAVLLAGHRVVTEADPRLNVIADRQAAERILTNLLMNAAKYSPDGTTIVVSARSDGDRIAVAVTDQGTGIAPEERERVFDSFYRGSRTNGRSGLGLGLAIVRRLVELHDGTVSIATSDRGSTFTVLLPAAPSSGAAIVPAAAYAPAERAG